MPGQYKHLAQALGAEGKHRIFFITKHKTAEIPGVTRVTYGLKKPEKPPEPHRYLKGATYAVIQGQQVWRICHALKTHENFVPDIVIAHPGWGDALFIKDIFPTTRILSFFEFYYRSHGADVGFDEAAHDDDFARVRMKNTTNLINLEQADWGIAPTVWQWSLHPRDAQHKISVLHDGIDVEVCKPDPAATLSLPSGKSFKPGDEVLTYVARNFEPYRGFPTFMRAAEILLKQRPNLQIIAVGADEVSYGRKAEAGKTYRQIWSEKVSLPEGRIHFPGMVPYDALIKLFQVSAAHLYLTYPFVLSWSMLEAMASGVALVASNTKPVLEVVEDGVNGLLADFFSPEDVAEKINQLLDDPTHNHAMRTAARQMVVDRFDLKKLLPLHLDLVHQVAQGQLPPPAAQKIQEISPIAPYAQARWDQ